MCTCSFVKLNVYVLKIDLCHFVVSRMIYGILPHKYDIISGLFPNYLQKIKKINNTFKHKFSIMHGFIEDSLLK